MKQQPISEILLKMHSNLNKKAQNLYYHLNQFGLRQKSSKGELEQSFFRIITYLSYLKKQNLLQRPIILMVTASHNPPEYNGIKINSIEEQLPSSIQLEEMINNCQRFVSFVKSNFNFEQIMEEKAQNTQIAFFIGRDCRPTSLRLSQIIINCIELLGLRVINLGQGSTPENYSLSKFIYSELQHNQKFESMSISKLKNQYFLNVLSKFKRCIQLIEEIKAIKWNKSSISLDFANGSGAISFKNYEVFLQEYFQFSVNHYEDFDHPNRNCGADYIFTNRNNLKQILKQNNNQQINESPFSKQCEFVYYFDGDSDRVIGRLQGQFQIIDGDNFNAMFATMLKQIYFQEIVQNLQQTSTIIEKKQLIQSLRNLRQGVIGSISSNKGLKDYLEKEGIILKLAPVGITHVFEAMQLFDFGCFFEPNGHGCLYFSQKCLNILEKLLIYPPPINKYAELLLCFHSISQNNCKGYALHNFLISQIYLFFTKGEVVSKKIFLFPKIFVLDPTYQITNIDNFENSTQGDKLLSKPTQIADLMFQISKNYEKIQIKIRKSNTTSILRVFIQGNQIDCKLILSKVEEIVKKYL